MTQSRTLVYYDPINDNFMLWDGHVWIMEYFEKEVVLTWDLSVGDTMIFLGDL